MSNRDIRFVGSYEARTFPKGWQHPRDAEGRHIPVLPFGYRFDEGGTAETMPEAAGETEIAAYETVSEGMPISPAFPNTPDGKLDLLRYCAEHCKAMGRRTVDAEAWAALLFGDAGITLDGRVINEG